MKKLSQFSKKIFTLLLMAMFAFGLLAGCSSSNLKVIPKDMDALKSLLKEKGNFNVHEDILKMVSKRLQAYMLILHLMVR